MRAGLSMFGLKAMHGFKAHVGVDTALVEEVAIAPANVNDGKAGPEALPDDPGEVFADSAYRGDHFRKAVQAKGGTPRVIATDMWGEDTEEDARPTCRPQQADPPHTQPNRADLRHGVGPRALIHRNRFRAAPDCATNRAPYPQPDPSLQYDFLDP